MSLIIVYNELLSTSDVNKFIGCLRSNGHDSRLVNETDVNLRSEFNSDKLTNDVLDLGILDNKLQGVKLAISILPNQNESSVQNHPWIKFISMKGANIPHDIFYGGRHKISFARSANSSSGLTKVHNLIPITRDNFYNQTYFSQTPHRKRAVLDKLINDMRNIASVIYSHNFNSRNREAVLIGISISNQIDIYRAYIEDQLPNSDESRLVKSTSLEALNWIQNRVLNLLELVDLEKEINSLPPAFTELAVQYGEEMRRWLHENKEENVDNILRLGPATSFIALLSAAGANMVWATPIVLGMFGGRKVIEEIRKGRGSSDVPKNDKSGD